MKAAIYLLIITRVSIVLSACSHSSASSQVPVDKTINNKGVRIAYTDQGNGDTTLLFVHGWCINQTYWQAQVKHFSKRYRVITMDLPGFGQSGKNRKQWNTLAFASDVNAVITQLHLQKVVLIGHSMAGDIVVQAAVTAPKSVIALVGIDNFQSVGVGGKPTAKDSAAYRQAVDSLKHHFSTVAVAYAKQDLFAPATSQAVRTRVLYNIAHADTVIAAACMDQDNFNEADKLQHLGKKLYLINSDFHATNTSGMQARHIPYQLLIIHATGHFPMIEQPAIFNQLLSKTLADMGNKSG